MGPRKVVYKNRRQWKLNCKIVGECWEWKHGYGGDGYGIVSYEGTPEHAHRMAYRLFKGDPAGVHILHSCDNRRCVRPKHLSKGSHSENIKASWVRHPGAVARRAALSVRARINMKSRKDLHKLTSKRMKKYWAKRRAEGGKVTRIKKGEVLGEVYD